jgi:hypothetical protein
MRIKWDPGQRYVYRMEIKQMTDITIPQRKQPMKQAADIVQEYSITVLKDGEPAGRQLEMEYLATQMEVQINGRSELAFDSAGDSLAPETNPIVESFRKIIGMKIQFHLDESNQVQRIEGLEAFNANILNKAPAQAKAALSGMFGEETFKQMVDLGKGLPPQPVKPGDTWNSRTEVTAGPMGKMLVDMDYTFIDWEVRGERQCAQFDFVGTLESLPSDSTAPMGMKMDLKNGVLSGKSWFDPELGMMTEFDMKEKMDMDMTMPVPKLNDKVGGTQTIQTKIDQQVRLKLVELGGKVL